MRVFRLLVGVWLAMNLLVKVDAQPRDEQPSIDFGGARIALGMTIETVKQNLAANGRHLQFLNDGVTEMVVLNNSTEPFAGEGQVTFIDGRVAYASFQFPETRDAVQLAQELAGAIENVETTDCTLRNFTAHGTGGGHSDIIATCGPKTIMITTIDPLGGDRFTNVVIEIGSLTRGNK